jgi:hypothetical protein
VEYLHRLDGGVVSEERDRILDKLDEIDRRGVDTLIAVTEIKGQVQQLPELKQNATLLDQRIQVLERTRWLAMGALAVGGSSFGMQIVKLLGG